MPRPTIRTERTDCRTCRRRIILIRSFPPLDYARDPHGTFAVTHQASGAYTARWLGQGEAAIPPEHRHAKHECGRTGDPG
jgi:hypothetical protein